MAHRASVQGKPRARGCQAERPGGAPRPGRGDCSEHFDPFSDKDPVRFAKAIKRATDSIFGPVPVRVIGGDNRGIRWSLASAGGGYGTGKRAAPQMAMLSALISPGDIVWDVGAHHGFVTLMASKRVGPHGRVHAFEPGERNRRFFNRHLKWNRVTNVVVHDVALSSYDGEASFGGEGSSRAFALNAGTERVRVRRAETMIASGDAPSPSFLKIDVEGEEANALLGLLPALEPSARMSVACHRRDTFEACDALLAQAGFHLFRSRALSASIAGSWYGDPDLIAFGPAYAGREADLERLRALEY